LYDRECLSCGHLKDDVMGVASTTTIDSVPLSPTLACIVLVAPAAGERHHYFVIFPATKPMRSDGDLLKCALRFWRVSLLRGSPTHINHSGRRRISSCRFVGPNMASGRLELGPSHSNWNSMPSPPPRSAGTAGPQRDLHVPQGSLWSAGAPSPQAPQFAHGGGPPGPLGLTGPMGPQDFKSSRAVWKPSMASRS